MDVRSPIPVHWFLDDKDDVRSSYYLEDVATEFHVQGLELDWACVTWDGDFRCDRGWEHWSFCGNRWNRIQSPQRKVYLKNAYRVLLTRARQGMVIFVPEGDAADPTRQAGFYDPTYEYLRSIGVRQICSGIMPNEIAQTDPVSRSWCMPAVTGDWISISAACTGA